MVYSQLVFRKIQRILCNHACEQKFSLADIHTYDLNPIKSHQNFFSFLSNLHNGFVSPRIPYHCILYHAVCVLLGQSIYYPEYTFSIDTQKNVRDNNSKFWWIIYYWLWLLRYQMILWQFCLTLILWSNKHWSLEQLFLQLVSKLLFQ